MKFLYRYYFTAIISLIISVCLFIAFLISNNNERNRFVNFNRSTVPDNDLEQIKSPTAITLSFNKYYHLDSIQLHDEYGNQIINISTIYYNSEDRKDYSNVSADNYCFFSPYHWPLNEKQYSIINAMEALANCNFASYQKMQAPDKVTIFDYLDHGLPQIFNEKVFKPLLQSIFDHTLYIRVSSPESIIKAIQLNQVGTISSVHLYNGEILELNESLDSSPQKTYEDLFHASIDEKTKKRLADFYKRRLSLHSLKDYSHKAETLADKHIKEICHSLLTEKIEFLGKRNYNTAYDQVKIWEDIKKTTYPNWIEWLLGLALLTFFAFITFSLIAHNKWKRYKRLQIRLNDITAKFPNASRKHNIFTTKDKIGHKEEQLLNQEFSIWEKEEQEIIRQQKQISFVSQKVLELKKLYPNGWDKVKKSHLICSDSEMISFEDEIAQEEEKFQLAKETARLEELERIKKEKEAIKKELQLLSLATQVGEIELAEEKIQTLNEITKSPTVDKELVKIVELAKKDYLRKYTEGISDTFDISYVDYTHPSEFVQGDNWNYAVVKFPSKGTFVFPYRRRKIARRGYMEKTFQTYLENKLSGSKLLILDDCAILPAENYRPYEPDIAIVDIEHPSIRIDIEIDEPYSAITNKPIHYIGCGDDFRDMNLNNLGWIVVRFTEYQIKSNIQSCVSFIAQLIHSLNPSKPLPKPLLVHDIPQIQKRWTEIEAKIMASEKAREKYLNHEFGIIDNEQIEIADIKQTEREKSCTKMVKPLMVTPQYWAEKSGERTIVFENDKHIQFLPQEHIYIYNGLEQLIPVSSVISCFFKPFDSFYWSEYKAKQRHILQGQVLEEWDAKGACSRDVGTFMHQQIQNYYNGLPYQQEFSFKYKGKYVQIEEQIKLEPEYSQFKEFLKNHKFKPFRTEWTIYDEKLKIAGTIDMIHKRGEVFDIYDWKRSHRIVDFLGNPITINNFGEKGLGELCQIDDTPYWHYCIQQNLYRYILEENYNIKVEKMYLIVFCDDVNEYSKLEVPYMNETINSIVKACNNGIVKKRLISLRGENLS